MNTLQAHAEGSTLLLKVTLSRLDASTAREFKEDCAQAWMPQATMVVADLTTLEFIDSSGVGALLSIYKRLPAPNPVVRLRGVQPPVKSVIELLRLNKIFEME